MFEVTEYTHEKNPKGYYNMSIVALRYQQTSCQRDFIFAIEQNFAYHYKRLIFHSNLDAHQLVQMPLNVFGLSGFQTSTSVPCRAPKTAITGA